VEFLFAWPCAMAAKTMSAQIDVSASVVIPFDFMS